MSIALHIDPFSAPVGDVGVTAPEVSPAVSPLINKLDFITRIWMWLSQIWGGQSFEAAAEAVFSLGAEDALDTAPPYRPNRHMRRMIARRARGIFPASRYTAYGQGGPLRAGLSLAELQAWARGRCRRTRFQTRHWKYYIRAYFSRMALWLARKFPSDVEASGGVVCHAPLCLE